MSNMASNVSKYQKFDMETISRQDIKNADYNPRQITKEAEKQLREGLRKHGLVAPITWNKRTGNVVGGHQRLKQLDALEKSANYELTVAVIDVEEREEAALNVQLNNQSMMGEWDLDKLADMTSEFDLDFTDMGFTDLDVDLLFDGDDRFSSMFEGEEQDGIKADIQGVRDAREKSRELLKEKNQVCFYVTVAFSDQEEREEFMRKISVPVYEEFITKEQLDRAYKD
jgi:hypothetical protein